MKLQIIITEGGEELVVLSRRAFDDILARLGLETMDDWLADREAAEIQRRIAAGEETLLTGFPADMEHLGAPIVRANRERAGRSAAEVAAAAGLGVDEYEAIERGEVYPGPEVWRRLAGALDIDPSWLPGAHSEALPTWSNI